MKPEVKVRRRRGFTRLSRQNQVTIPADVVAAAGLSPGDELKVEADGRGRIVLFRPESRLDAFVGDLTGVYGEGYVEKLRGEWD